MAIFSFSNFFIFGKIKIFKKTKKNEIFYFSNLNLNPAPHFRRTGLAIIKVDSWSFLRVSLAKNACKKTVFFGNEKEREIRLNFVSQFSFFAFFFVPKKSDTFLGNSCLAVYNT